MFSTSPYALSHIFEFEWERERKTEHGRPLSSLYQNSSIRCVYAFPMKLFSEEIFSSCWIRFFFLSPVFVSLLATWQFSGCAINFTVLFVVYRSSLFLQPETREMLEERVIFFSFSLCVSFSASWKSACGQNNKQLHLYLGRIRRNYVSLSLYAA